MNAQADPGLEAPAGEVLPECSGADRSQPECPGLEWSGLECSGPECSQTERSPAEILLDEALDLGARELDALAAGNVEEAEELCAQRAKLLEESWALNNEQGADLRSRLLAMQSLQERLMERGQALQKEIREGLRRSRQQSQRMRGYGLAVRQALMQ